MLHENECLNENMLDIVNNPPSTIDKKLCGQKINISFHREYDFTFTKEDFPGRVYFFDIGKIKSVLADVKCDDGTRAIVKMTYDQDVYQVPLNLEDYASDKVKVAEKEHQWRLLTPSLSTSDNAVNSCGPKNGVDDLLKWCDGMFVIAIDLMTNALWLKGTMARWNNKKAQ